MSIDHGLINCEKSDEKSIHSTSLINFHTHHIGHYEYQQIAMLHLDMYQLYNDLSENFKYIDV